MIRLSLCLIVKNEEAVLERCLQSFLEVADELIIVDTGSTDKTKEIAAKFTENLFDFCWEDDFSAARNFSFQKAGCEYLMWVDADDILPPTEKQKLLRLKETLSPQTDVVMLKYHTSFDENGSPSFAYYRERIVKNHPLAVWQGAVHEVISPFGNVIYEDIAIEHRKEKPAAAGRNLKIYENQLQKGAVFSPREQFYYARELFYNGFPAESAQVFRKFLQDANGWSENNIDACRMLASCYNQLGQPEKALQSLLQTFYYGPPRAESCCDLGLYFFAKGEYQTATFWYLAALNCKKPEQTGAFVLPDCYGYIPCIQLAVCFFHLGKADQALFYNHLAGQEKPYSAANKHNLAFFASAKNPDGK